MADSAWIDTEDGRKCVVTFLDHATRYVAIRILKTERSEEFVKGLERVWIKDFGIPQILRVDGAKGWSSKYIRKWCADRGIALEVAPGEAHNWLAPVERKHQVVRKALEHYMHDRGAFNIKTLEEARIYVPHQINNMSMVKGFSPAQWVFGRTPASTHSLQSSSTLDVMLWMTQPSLPTSRGNVSQPRRHGSTQTAMPSFAVTAMPSFAVP